MEADVGSAYNHMVLGKLLIFLLVEVDQQLIPDAPKLKSNLSWPLIWALEALFSLLYSHNLRNFANILVPVRLVTGKPQTTGGILWAIPIW